MKRTVSVHRLDFCRCFAEKTSDGLQVHPLKAEHSQNKKLFFVLGRGLEPPRIAPLVPKTNAATNYAILAWYERRDLNSYDFSLGFEASVSADSTTLAFLNLERPEGLEPPA